MLAAGGSWGCPRQEESRWIAQGGGLAIAKAFEEIGQTFWRLAVSKEQQQPLQAQREADEKTRFVRTDKQTSFPSFKKIALMITN